MSLGDYNRMLHILYGHRVNRKNVTHIMDDIKKSGIFEEDEIEINDNDWEYVEEQAYWLFNSRVSNDEKDRALKTIKIEQEEYEKTRKSQYLIDQEKRVYAKRRELIKKGIIKPDLPSHEKSLNSTTRYGRSPLHEAIAMRDIRLVEKYLKKGKYLNKVDNNGHTALEMAYYDNYKEALILFNKYTKSKN